MICGNSSGKGVAAVAGVAGVTGVAGGTGVAGATGVAGGTGVVVGRDGVVGDVSGRSGDVVGVTGCTAGGVACGGGGGGGGGGGAGGSGAVDSGGVDSGGVDSGGVGAGGGGSVVGVTVGANTSLAWRVFLFLRFFLPFARAVGGEGDGWLTIQLHHIGENDRAAASSACSKLAQNTNAQTAEIVSRKRFMSRARFGSFEAHQIVATLFANGNKLPTLFA